MSIYLLHHLLLLFFVCVSKVIKLNLYKEAVGLYSLPASTCVCWSSTELHQLWWICSCHVRLTLWVTPMDLNGGVITSTVDFHRILIKSRPYDYKGMLDLWQLCSREGFQCHFKNYFSTTRLDQSVVCKTYLKGFMTWKKHCCMENVLNL